MSSSWEWHVYFLQHGFLIAPTAGIYEFFISLWTFILEKRTKNLNSYFKSRTCMTYVGQNALTGTIHILRKYLKDRNRDVTDGWAILGRIEGANGQRWRAALRRITKGGFFSESGIHFFYLQISTKKYSKKLSWAWKLKFPPITANNVFKFKAQDSFLEYFFGRLQDLKNESHFLKKNTFKSVVFI